ncbi:MAG: hypothetical protein LBM99_02410 [Bacillales bacterium]|jgi:competence protein ComFC|nr:hypothetical protein [Bacillales bacterium]
MQLKQFFKPIVCKACFKTFIPLSLENVFENREKCLCKHCYEQMNPNITIKRIKGIEHMFLYEYKSYFRELLYRFKGCYDLPLKDIFLDYYLNILKMKYYGYSVVPIPSNESENIERGFNHVTEVFKLLNLPILEVLEKNKPYKQADRNGAERKEIEKVLVLKEPIKANSKILIVDDVYTTGNTIRAAVCLVLKYSKRIKVLLLAKNI